MRVLIIFGFIGTLSVVLCREYRSNHQDNAPIKIYKDTKNKRGVGDYPFGLSFEGPSFSAFQSPPPHSAGASFASGFTGFGGFGGGSPLSISSNPFGISSPSPSFSSLGSSGLGSLSSYGSVSQPLSLGQGSGYSLSGSALNLPNLLGSLGSTSTSHFSPNIGFFTTSDKNGPVTLAAQSATTGQTQQHTPVYATTAQIGSNSYVSPTVSSSSQAPSIQEYSQPSSVSISSLLSGNGLTYSSPSSSSLFSSSADLSSHAINNNYVITAAPQSGGGSSQSYSVPLSTVSSSSSPTYSIAIPTSYGTTTTSSASSSPSSMYQVSIAPSTYSIPPMSSTPNHFTKYIPISSDRNTYLHKSPINTYKLSSYASPGMIYQSSSKPVVQQTTSTGINYAPSGTSSQSVTSYGTPVVMFSIPSTSYGTPSQRLSSSNAQYTSSSSGNTSPSIGYAAASSYSNPSSTSSSSSHQTESLQKGLNNKYGSSYISSNSNDGSSTGASVESTPISGYKIQSPSSTSTLIENYSSTAQSSTRDDGTDSSSSYSNHTPRYIRYPIGRPSPYIDSDEEESISSSYDTISYSVPSEKY